MSAKKKVFILLIPAFLVLMIGFGITTSAKAVEFDEDGIIAADEVINDDLFIGAETVEIYGTVNGDVIAAGSIVRVDGTVNGSLVTGAQSVLVNGDVKGSIYSGSSTFTLGSDASVGRNLYYGGFNLSAESGSVVGRDLLVGAYQALLSGEVERDVRAATGALEINGVVGNDVYAEVAGTDESGQAYYFTGPPGVDTVVPSGIRVSDDAKIGGKLTYKSSEDQSDAIEIKPAGGINFEYDPSDAPKRDEPKHGSPGGLVAAYLFKRVQVFITLMLLGGLVVWQLPALLKRVGGKVEKESMPSLGWGLVTVMVVYMGAFIVAGLIIAGAIFFGVVTLGELSMVILTVGFSSLALFLAGFGLLVSYGSKLVVAFMVGRLIIRWLAPQYEEQPIWSMLLGVLIYTFLRSIPIFGFMIGLFVTLIGIGAMWLVYREYAGPDKALVESE
jgi:cytoskeletal protein CcmA (bactofilin family)